MYDKFPFFLKKGVTCKETLMNFKNQATALLEQCLTEWENDPTRMDSGYQYELSYATMLKKFEKGLLALSTGKVPKSKNSKKKSKLDLET